MDKYQAENLTQGELAERVAVLKRFKALLKEQREKFREYLEVLEHHEESIVKEDVDAILSHAELEESIITEIFTIQKVIDPMEEMYKTVTGGQEHSETIELKDDLKNLQKMVLDQNKKNREKLKTHLLGIRKQINSLKRPYAKNSSVFSESLDTAHFIDVNA